MRKHIVNMKEFSIRDLYSIRRNFTGMYAYEVQTRWGENMLELDADNAAQAKRIALRVFNNEMSLAESIETEGAY